MTIIAPLPFTLQNGTTADADQVMADLNQIRNDVNSAFSSSSAPAQGYRGAVVTNAGQSFTFGVLTPITFTSEYIDTGSIHDNSVNPSRLTVPSGITKVRLLGSVVTSSPIDDGAFILLTLLKNGSGASPQTTIIKADSTSGDQWSGQLISSTISCTAGDYFQLAIRMDSTANNSIGLAWFEMQVLA